MGNRKKKYHNAVQNEYMLDDSVGTLDSGGGISGGGGGGGGIISPPPMNQPPVVNPGVNQTITLPTDSIQLDGSQSYDPDTGALNFQWTLENGPTIPTIINANKAIATAAGLQAGNYGFRLTISDGMGATDTGLVYISVLPAPSSPPFFKPPPPPPPPPPPALPDGGTGITTNLTPSPVLTTPQAPYQTSYSAPATPAAPPAKKKVDWLFWSIVGVSVGYITFAKNE